MTKLQKAIIKWLLQSKLVHYPRAIFIEILKRTLRAESALIFYYIDPDRRKIMALIKKIKEETEMLLFDNEAYQIFMAVKRTGKVKGDVAEVGVYRGGSAKLICEAKGDRALYLFDTFEGIPKIMPEDCSKFSISQYKTSYEDVKYYLKNYENVYLYKGIFPLTADPIRDSKFSFVNLDVDTYASTLDCLNFFYPRMNAGGIIISHDYITAAGVKKAFDIFFENEPEPIIEMSGSQCLVVKL